MKAPKVQEIQRADLERLLERARPSLTEAEYEQLKAALDTLVYLTQLLSKKNTTIARLRQILFGASSEKSAEVLKSLAGKGQPAGEASSAATAAGAGGAKDAAQKAPGHGRNGAQDYPGANTVVVEHPSLKPGDLCPECRRGKLYELEPGSLVRVTGQAPLGATIYALQKLRCNLCLQVFSTPAPEGVGPEKYDAGAASMIALLKYGSGVPFYRLEGLQQSLGIVLPASTQWDIVDQGERLIKPVFEELVRQAAQGEVLQNDDTTAKILARMKPAKEDSTPGKAKRTGIFTTCIVSRREARTIALFFTGKGHAGENLAQVLAQRAVELAPPIQMCDGLEHNVPKAFQTVLANCLAHARRKYVEVTPGFPEQCRYVLETLAQVYRHDALCREQKLTPEQRLAFHQSHSRPLMEALKSWLTEQIDEHRVEPNCGLGEAIGYMNKHWKELTLFLRKAGAPLDNNNVEQALKRAILHRKNAYFYRTDRGAQVGDTFMSLIHTCALGEVNAFEYLKALLENAAAVCATPAQWMPWNWRDNLPAPDSS